MKNRRFRPVAWVFVAVVPLAGLQQAVARDCDGNVIHNALGHGEGTSEAFREGFADTVALLVYDFPDLFIGHGGEGTSKSYDFATNPSLRKVDPCSNSVDQCQDPNAPLGPPEPNCCGSILAGIWWDIKLNMQAKYGGVGARRIARSIRR